MATCMKFSYPDTDVVKRFEELFGKIENMYLNKWYSIGNGGYIYQNGKFYYHLVVLKKNALGFYLDDYVCSRKGELVYSTTHGYFKSKEDIFTFINEKIA